MHFDYSIFHVAGKLLTTADTLSRAPLRAFTNDDETLCQDTGLYVNMIMNHLPASDKRLNEVKQAQESDDTCKAVMHYCREGWPQHVKGLMKKYAAVPSELSIHNGLLLKGHRLVKPPSLQPNILDSIHAGHQGITKCRQRARTLVWRPGINQKLEEYVTNCPTCGQHRFQPPEPLLATKLPQYPWQKQICSNGNKPVTCLL